MKTTGTIGLRKPEDNDTVNVADFNYNADVIDGKLEEQGKQIGNLSSQVEGIDVTTDVEEVVNRRLNTDKLNPLNVLLENVKNYLGNLISLLPQKSIWTDVRGAKLDNLDMSMTSVLNAIRSIKFGDYNGKIVEYETILMSNGVTKSYSNPKGGIVVINPILGTDVRVTIVLDGITKLNQQSFYKHFGMITKMNPIIIPFNSSFSITIYDANADVGFQYYLNQ